MKSKISHVFSFIIMATTFLLIIYLGFEFSIRNRVIQYNLDKIIYYDRAYDNIDKKLKEYIVNDDVRKEYMDYISKEMIKEDIYNIINKKEVDHYLDFYKIIEKYDDNPDIDDLYARNINDIYKSNIFPTKEYNMISKFKLSDDFIPVLFMFIAILITLSVVLKKMNKKKKYLSISFTGVFILFLFLFLGRIYINNFYYSNSYFTMFLKSIIDTNLAFYVGIILIFIVILIVRELIVDKK